MVTACPQSSMYIQKKNRPALGSHLIYTRRDCPWILEESDRFKLVKRF